MEFKKEIIKPKILQVILPIIGFLFVVVIGCVVIPYSAGIAVFVFIVSLPVLLIAVVVGSRRLVIDPKKISVQSVLGRKELKWDNITDAQLIYAYAPGGNYPHITLHSSRGRKSIQVSPSFQRLDMVIDFMLTEVPRKIIGQIRAGFEKGLEYGYGKLKLNPRGVIVGKEIILWGDLKTYKVTEGQVEFSFSIYAHNDDRPLKFDYADHVAKQVISGILDEKIAQNRGS
ncbi:MAG: PH domain-containing protein [Planctomycetota bacterium]|nr:MAG: PH domain-containing protein [Planctomycetota bacterium]